LTGPESALPLDPEPLELLPEPEPLLDDELPELPLELEELEPEEVLDPELLELRPDPDEPPELDPPELLELNRPPDPELPELPLVPELLLDLAEPLLASDAVPSVALASEVALALSSLEPQAHKTAVPTATANKRVPTRMVRPSSGNSRRHPGLAQPTPQ
jgi:hypothetical protein